LLYCKAHAEKPQSTVVLKLYSKGLVNLLYMRVSVHFGQGKRYREKAGEVVRKTQQGSRYAILVSQWNPKVVKLPMNVAEDLE